MSDDVLRAAGRMIARGVDPGPFLAMFDLAAIKTHHMAVGRAWSSMAASERRAKAGPFGTREQNVCYMVGIGVTVGSDGLWGYATLTPEVVRAGLRSIMVAGRFPETCRPTGAAGPGKAISLGWADDPAGVLRHARGVGRVTADRIVAYAEQVGPVGLAA